VLRPEPAKMIPCGNEPIMGTYLAQSCGVAYVVYGRECDTPVWPEDALYGVRRLNHTWTRGRYIKRV